MPSAPETLQDALERLQMRFDEESHAYPTLRHVWIRGEGRIDEVLRRITINLARPLVETTRWQMEDGNVDYCCFFGTEKQLRCFREIAEQAHTVLYQGLGWVCKSPYPSYISWLVELYNGAHERLTPRPKLDYFLIGFWPNAVIKVLPLPASGRNEASDKSPLEGLKKSLGDPLCVYLVQALREDVFTSSKVLIEGAMKAIAAAERESFRSLLTQPFGQTVATRKSARSNASSQSTARRQRPPWASDPELIGPCTQKQFAELLNVSSKSVYRLVEDGLLWKEAGPSPKRYYFQHRDQATNRKLRESFERSKVAKASDGSRRNK